MEPIYGPRIFVSHKLRSIIRISLSVFSESSKFLLAQGSGKNYSNEIRLVLGQPHSNLTRPQNLKTTTTMAAATGKNELINSMGLIAAGVLQPVFRIPNVLIRIRNRICLSIPLNYGSGSYSFLPVTYMMLTSFVPKQP